MKLYGFNKKYINQISLSLVKFIINSFRCKISSLIIITEILFDFIKMYSTIYVSLI